MKARIGWVVIAAGLTCALGCRRATEDDVHRLEVIRVEACDCRDKACGERVLTEFKSYVSGISHKAATPEQTQRIQDAAKRTTTCMLKLGGAPASIRSASR